MRVGAAWRSFRDLAKSVKVASSWSVPVLGPSGLRGVITVFRTAPGAPQRDDRMSSGQRLFQEMATDETRSAGDKNFHARPRTKAVIESTT